MNNSNKVMIVLVLATTISASSHIYARVGFFHIAYAQPINQGAQLGLSPLDPPRVAANGERLPDDQPHHRHTSSTGDEGNNSDERQGTGASSDSNTNDNKDKSTIATATTHDSNNPDQNINTSSMNNNAEAGVKQQQPYTGILPSKIIR